MRLIGFLFYPPLAAANFAARRINSPTRLRRLFDDLNTCAVASVTLEFGFLWQSITFEFSGRAIEKGYKSPMARAVQLGRAVLKFRLNCPASKR